MNKATSGWAVVLSEFKAADRDFLPVASEELARVVLPYVNCKLDYTEDAENGVYVVTLTENMYIKLVTTGSFETEFRTRDGVFRIAGETDIDHIDRAISR